MQIAYWRRVALQAFADACSILWMESPVKVARNAIVVVVLVAAYSFLGSNDSAKEEIDRFVILTAIAVVAFPFLFLICSALIPAKWDDQKSKKIAELELQISNRSAAEDAAIKSLWNFRKEGISLRNKSLTESEVDGWVNEFMSWRQKVYAKLDELGLRLIKSTRQLRRRGKWTRGNFAPACRSGWQYA